MSRLSENFRSSEFACPCCGREVVAEKLVQGLQRLRDRLGVPLIVTSGFRCPAHNRDIGGAPGSYHTQGMAADIAGSVPLARLYFEAVGIIEFGGIGLYPDERFVHVDVRSNRSRWGRVGGEYCSLQVALEALKKRRTQ